jgi:hypothetical protein
VWRYGGRYSPGIHALNDDISEVFCKLVVTAYTGVAAAAFSGPTLLRLLNLGIDQLH